MGFLPLKKGCGCFHGIEYLLPAPKAAENDFQSCAQNSFTLSQVISFLFAQNIIGEEKYFIQSKHFEFRARLLEFIPYVTSYAKVCDSRTIGARELGKRVRITGIDFYCKTITSRAR
jgi:hypothetical protein